MSKRQIPLAVPGEILLQELLKRLGGTQYRLAKEVGVPLRRMGEIVAGKRAITAPPAPPRAWGFTSASKQSSG